MKKLLIAASIFLALSVSAQKAPAKTQAKATYEQQYQSLNNDVKLSEKQKKEVKSLYDERDKKGTSDKDFDARMKKVLSKDQYNKYNANSNKYKTKQKSTKKDSPAKKAEPVKATPAKAQR